MSVAFAPIVEGHGDEVSVPLLLRAMAPSVRIHRPVRFPKTKLIKDVDLSRAVAIARSNLKPSERGFILLMLDADSDCAAELGPRLLQTMQDSCPGTACFVSVVVREFESWIVGGHPDFDEPDPDRLGNPKGIISSRNKGRYKETVDQPRFTAGIDVERLRRYSSSFRRLALFVERAISEHPV